MTQTTPPLSFIHDLTYAGLPEAVKKQAEMCLLDLLGIAIGGSTTRVAALIRAHAAREFGGAVPMVLDTRSASASGGAMALGMTIDSLDGHDGFNPAKGHVGCGVVSALLAMSLAENHMKGDEFLAALVMGYETGSRLAMALHGTVPDYHTSGAWVAVACAAVGARALGLDPSRTRHALGIAEYHGPRSQMMRCIDYPTMLKDGSGWGAMAGVSAAYLAQDGFTGAPAITIEDAPQYWADLGHRWYIMEQYFKPYPVCRWAQAPIEAVLDLRRTYGLTSGDVERIEVESFHESIRLATNRPTATDEAQYSTSYPCAVAMARGTVGAADIADEALDDPEIMRLSQSLTMSEDDAANAAFPGKRLARVRLHLFDGRVLQSGWHTPRWDATSPPSEAELRQKFHALADPLVGPSRAAAIEEAIRKLPQDGLAPLLDLIAQPINGASTASS